METTIQPDRLQRCWRRAWVLGAAFLLTSGLAPLGAAQVRAVLRVDGEPPSTEPVEGLLVAEPLVRSEDPRAVQRVEQTCRLPGEARLELSPAHPWRLRAEIPGYWAEPKLLASITTGQTVSLSLRPTGTFEGRLVVPHNEALPTELDVRFQSDEIGESHVLCPVAPSGQWSCEVPAGIHDLRLRATGFVSHFLWGVELRPRSVDDLGTQRLERGASVVGRVKALEGELSPSQCVVEILPFESGPQRDAAEPSRMSRLVHSQKCGQGGFFHFQGLPPGSWRLEARQPGLAPARLAPVTTLENAETEIREPLLLQPPAELEVHLAPPVDLLEKPWSLDLLRFSEIVGRADQVAAGPTLEGVFAASQLEPGRYLLQVRDSQGGQFLTEDIELDSGRTRLDLELPLVWVEGTLRLGEEPLSAEIWFGGPFGDRKVHLTSDAEGEFFGVLPAEGKWLVYVEAEEPPVVRQLESVEVRASDGGRVATVRLRLPDTRLEGEVVYADGSAAAGALVRLQDEEASRDTVTVTDAEGAFTFAGLGEGLARVVAEHGDAASDEVQIQVTEDLEPPPLRLVLEARKPLRGRVVSPEGRPLPGVAVAAEPIALGASLLGATASDTTDVTGAFEISIPAQATQVGIVAYPAGYPLYVEPPRSVPEEPLTLQVDAQGGALTFELAQAVDWRDPSSPQPFLLIEGVLFTFRQLNRWAAINGHINTEPFTMVRVPALPPGRLTACLGVVPEARSPRASRQQCKEVLIAPFSESTVKLELEEDGG